MKWAILVVIITGILTTVWITGFKEGQKRGEKIGAKRVADEAFQQVTAILSDGAIIWLQGGIHLLRKCEQLKAYLLEVMK